MARRALTPVLVVCIDQYSAASLSLLAWLVKYTQCTTHWRDKKKTTKASFFFGSILHSRVHIRAPDSLRHTAR
ncbi:hypothetical protein EDB87DRAFT_1649351 [Lactarius vividus]|nr:hypothetical protein EDB87DRAFT_1649351 [Lactarius vividus]